MADEAGKADKESREEFRARALAVAAELFASQGVRATSVRQIARELGVSHTYVHMRFGTKDDLIDAVLMEGDPGFVKAFTESARIDTIVESVTRRLLRNPNDQRVLAAALLGGVWTPALDERRSAQRAYLERIRAELADRERAAGDVDVRVAAAAAAALLVGWAVIRDWAVPAFDLQDEYPEVIEDELVKVVTRILETAG
jgi:AcrR family transcriptional regulator